MKKNSSRRMFNIYGYTGGSYGGNVYDTEYLAPTLTNFVGGGNRHPLIIDIKYMGVDGEPRVYEKVAPTISARDYKEPLRGAERSKELRIRKLTPSECWKLMGFDKEDFEKARKVNSDTQLYKQAGNSIVVNVLEAIFREMLPK